MRSVSRYLATILLSLLAVAAFAANSSKSTVRREADVTLTAPLQLGNIVLQPGVYTFQHRMKNGEHFLHIQKSELDPYINGNGYPQYNMIDVADVKCQMKESSGKISQTQLTTTTSDGTSIVELSIAGEDVVHVIE